MSEKKKVTEKQVENYLVTQIERLEGWCIKFPPLFFRGFPDRIILMPGAVIVFAELKAPGETPRPIQLKVQNKLRAFGFRVEVLDTYDAVDGLIMTI